VNFTLADEIQNNTLILSNQGLNMIAIILAGGFAKRLWPITREIPKPLLWIGNKKIIDYVLEPIMTLDVDRIIITTNARFAHLFAPLKELDERIIINVESAMDEVQKLGSIGALREIFQKYEGDSYLVAAGDNVTSMNFKDFVRFYYEKNKDGPASIVAVYDVGSPEKAKRMGVVKLSGEKIIYFVEKPSEPISSLAATACYIFPREHAIMINDYLKSGGNPDAPGYFLEWLYKRANVYAYIFRGFWFDIGTPDGLLEAFMSLVKESIISEKADISGKVHHPVIIEDGVRIKENSIVGPYVYIGRGTIINNSKVQKTLIFENCEISNCEINRCLIGGYAKVRGIKIKDSVIGYWTKIFSYS